MENTKQKKDVVPTPVKKENVAQPEKQKEKVTLSSIKKYIDEKITEAIDNRVSAMVGQILVEHKLIRPKGNAKKDLLLAQLAKVQAMQDQILNELYDGKPPKKEIPLTINESVLNEVVDAPVIDEDLRKKEIADQRLRLLKKQNKNMSPEEKAYLEMYDELADYSGRPVPNASYVDPNYVSSLYGSGGNQIREEYQAEDQIDHYYQQEARTDAPRQVDPMQRYSEHMSIANGGTKFAPIGLDVYESEPVDLARGK